MHFLKFRDHQIQNYIAWRAVQKSSSVSTVSIKDVSADSAWVNGFDWMSGNKDDFPMTAVKDLKLNQSDLSKVHQENYPAPTNPEH